MTNLDGPVGELLAEMIPRVAARVHRGYPAVPTEDLEQEMWAHALSKPVKYRDLVKDGKDAVIWEDLRRAGRRACREDERYRRAVKAAEGGYRVDDEQFYTIPLLRILLAAYVDEGVVEFAPQRRSEGRTGHGDAAEHGDYMVMLIDTGKALDELKPHQRNLLKQYFAVSQEDNESGRWARQQLASSMGLTLAALDMRVSRALRALQHQLGGGNPWPRAAMTVEAREDAGRTAVGSTSAIRREKLRSAS